MCIPNPNTRIRAQKVLKKFGPNTCIRGWNTGDIAFLFTRPLFVGTRGGAGFSTFSMSGLSVAVRGGVQMRYVASSSMSAFFSREKRPGGPLRGGVGRGSTRRCCCELDVTLFFGVNIA